MGVGPLSILLSVLTSVFTPPTLTKKKYKAPLKAVFGHLHDQQRCSSGFIKCQHHPGQVKEQRPTENNITGFGGGGDAFPKATQDEKWSHGLLPNKPESSLVTSLLLAPHLHPVPQGLGDFSTS